MWMILIGIFLNNPMVIYLKYFLSISKPISYSLNLSIFNSSKRSVYFLGLWKVFFLFHKHFLKTSNMRTLLGLAQVGASQHSMAHVFLSSKRTSRILVPESTGRVHGGVRTVGVSPRKWISGGFEGWLFLLWLIQERIQWGLSGWNHSASSGLRWPLSLPPPAWECLPCRMQMVSSLTLSSHDCAGRLPQSTI